MKPPTWVKGQPRVCLLMKRIIRRCNKPEPAPPSGSGPLYLCTCGWCLPSWRSWGACSQSFPPKTRQTTRSSDCSPAWGRWSIHQSLGNRKGEEMGERLSSAPIINLEEMRQNWWVGGAAVDAEVAGCMVKAHRQALFHQKVEQSGSSSSRAP